MDGDSSGSIAPLAGVDKFFLRELINYMKDKLGYKILSHVLSLEPSAELKPHQFNQKDENDLMMVKDEKDMVEVKKGVGVR